MKWSGAVALVTGASRGIGRSVALAAAKRGAKVGLVARNAADLSAVASDVWAAGAEATTASADVADRGQVTAAVASVEAALGPIDIVVANAGIGAYGAFLDADL
ncbi:MAG: SDR family NAD(P)-dependent oxidoreductase, partial [Actinobacteria bacterium]|nr:SDR family NAD(P)-dependent oxidoreductase [Actinomycetota bacterium]